MIRTISYFLIGAFLTSQNAHPQKSTRLICGQVISREEAAPLEGVRVVAKGTGNISGSQQDGAYYIEVSDRDSVLVFSYEDFETREVRLTDANSYNIVLAKGPAQATQGLVQPTNGPAQPAEKPPFSPIGVWRAVFQLRPGIEVP